MIILGQGVKTDYGNDHLITKLVNQSEWNFEKKNIVLKSEVLLARL